jgi:nucleotide-binding universal stress UspA family protein
MADIIVVGVDGSETARQAAETAARLAAGTGSTLHIVTAYDTERREEIGVGGDRWVVSSGDDAKKVADSVAAGLTTKVSAVTTASALGKPHDVLLDEASRLDASMIVVGNRRMQGAGRLLGSVANSVAHSAPCDVYIVKTV